MNQGMSDVDRFFEYVDKQATGCWEWTSAKKPNGYGRFRLYSNNGKRRYATAHRWLWIHLNGDTNLTIDHLCRNTSCVNPDHLEPVTLKVNLLRGNGISGVNARKTHCIRGHKFTDENTYTPPNTEWRQCRVCNKLRKEGLTDAEDEAEGKA